MAGASLCIQGQPYLVAPSATPAETMMGMAAIILGIMLLIGYLTPIAAAAAGIAVIGVATSLLPTLRPNADFDAALIFVMTILISLIGLGPGAFSADARRFGRREIIIPRPISRGCYLESID